MATYTAKSGHVYCQKGHVYLTYTANSEVYVADWQYTWPVYVAKPPRQMAPGMHQKPKMGCFWLNFDTGRA
jgi:hypothetical protein